MFLIFCTIPYIDGLPAFAPDSYTQCVLDCLPSRWHGWQRWMQSLSTTHDTHSLGSWRARDAFGGRRQWIYDAPKTAIDWGFRMDRKYLKFLRDNKPAQFLKEMTPNTRHDGACLGLDLKHPHHQALRREFQADVQHVCREKGLSEHPAMTKEGIAEEQQRVAREEERRIAEKQRIAWRIPDVRVARLPQVVALKEQHAEEVTSLKQEKSILEQEKAQLKGRVARLKNEKTQVQIKVTSLEKEKSTLRQEKAQVQKKAASLRRVKILAQRECTRLEREKSTLQKDSAREKIILTCQITELEERNRALSTKAHDLYICTQGKKIMLDPVVAADGETYEREVIEAWLLEHTTSPHSGEVLANTQLIANNGLRRQITQFLDANPALWESDSIYVSKRLADNLIAAVSACNIAEVERCIATDRRLLTRILTGDQHLLRLALYSSPKVLSAVVEALGDKLANLPEMKTDAGVGFFRMAAQSLGSPGAEIIANALKWGEAEIQEQFAYGVENDLMVVFACLNLGANIESVNADGSRPLHLAVTRGDSRLAQLLVERGANRAALNAAGHSSLHVAAIAGQTAMVSLLIETKPVDASKESVPFLDLCGTDHLSPLHHALNELERDEHFALLQRLVQAGADLEKPHPFTKDTALLQAIRMNHLEAFTLLLNRRERPADITAQDAAGLNALHLVIELEQTEQLTALLDKGADLESVTPKTKDTALLHAVRKNNHKLLKQLLSFKPDLNLEAKDAKNQTALHLAFSLGHIDLIPTLIQAGVDLEAKDDLGNTALLRAVIAKRLDLPQAMIERTQSPAKITAKNKLRNTALHLVASSGNGDQAKAMAAYLLEKGASGFARNTDGKKPEDVAFAANNDELAEFIPKHMMALQIRAQSPRAAASVAPKTKRRPKSKQGLMGEIIKFDDTEFRDTKAHRLGGSSFCSGVFERQDGTLYVGKSDHIATEDSAEAYACAEKIALDMYAYFGVSVPQTVLARLPIIFPEGVRATDLPDIGKNRTHTIYLMSEIIAGFHACTEVPQFSGGDQFMLQLPGQAEPLEVINFGRMLAVAKIIDDPDVLGASATNFVCQIAGNQVNCIKIDANAAFNENPALEVGPREVRFAMQSDYHTLKVDDLPMSVKKEFIETIVLFTQISIKDLTKFFVRPGTENLLSFNAGKNLREMPQRLLKRQAIFKAEYARELSGVKVQGGHLQAVQRTKVSEEDISKTMHVQKQGFAQRPEPAASVAAEPPVQYTINHKDLQYTERDCIGSGSFAQVYRGLWKGTEVAIKKLTLQQGLSLETGCEMRQEAAIMRRLNHANVMALYGICVDPGHISLVLKYLPNGSLFKMVNDLTRPLDWPMRLKLSLGVAKGIQYLHMQKIIHRDLKSLNILLDKDDTPVIADFGLSKVKTETHATFAQTKTAASSVGTVSWMAPELFRLRGKHTRASDIFAFAVILWELAARKIPWSDYDTANDTTIMSWTKDGERNTIPKNTPKPFAALIARCWSQTRRDRPKVVEITKALTAMHLEAKTAKDSGTLEASLWSERAVTAPDTLSEPKAASSSDASW